MFGRAWQVLPDQAARLFSTPRSSATIETRRGRGTWAAGTQGVQAAVQPSRPFTHICQMLCFKASCGVGEPQLRGLLPGMLALRD